METLEAERPSDYLTRLATSDVGRAYKGMVVDEMQVRPGSTVLDLGCGPGADLLAFAAATGPAGRVIGIDRDAEAIATAARTASGVPGVKVSVGDVHQLSLADCSVDRVHTDRVLQHVEHPASVVAEAARVLRAGGVAAFAEPDWDTLAIDHPDPEIAGAYRRFIVERVVRNPRMGRQLPRLCVEQGLVAARVVPVTAVYRDAVQADQVLGFRRVTSRAVVAGYVSDTDSAEWLRHISTGRIFVSLSLFVTLCEKPRS